MKTKYLYPCIVLLVLASGCIKDEGEELTIVRKDVVDDADAELNTIVTGSDGYMEGMATKDQIVTNSFTTEVDNNQITKLNCYTELQSKFTELNTQRNGIVSVGYVYSHENHNPVIGDSRCTRLDVSAQVSPTDAEVQFNGTLKGLDPNSTYYVRSFAVCNGNGDIKKDSIIYNSRVLEYKTVLPEDVWVQRSNAPESMGSRSNPFTCTKGSKVYIYGGRTGTNCTNDLWSYNSVSDTWEQHGTFEATSGHYLNTEKRCNGAMFAYPNTSASDTLLYIVGGELANGSYTGTVFFYSTKNNRFANQADHPNAGKMFPKYDEDGNPVYETEKDEDGNDKKDANGNVIYKTPKVQVMSTMSRAYVEDLPIYKTLANGTKSKFGLAGSVAFSLADNGFTKYFVAFGKNDMTGEDQKHIQTSVYEYDVTYDRTCNEVNELSEWTWKNLSAGNDRTAEGFYQPVCVQCGDRVILGSGESSRGNISRNFYYITYSISELNIRMESLPTNEEFNSGFKERANAAAFYLDYTSDGTPRNRFYVGTGRTCLEDNYIQEPEQLLNDFWCYDLNTREWSRKADCSNFVRQGAVGLTIQRADDYFVKNNYSVNTRGMFSFGEGYSTIQGYRTLNDNWEYIP